MGSSLESLGYISTGIYNYISPSFALSFIMKTPTKIQATTFIIQYINEAKVEYSDIQLRK